jgi:NAD(P)-dependent dehydrogenase (short-subunit alcohol dehydrogenase family)
MQDNVAAHDTGWLDIARHVCVATDSESGIGAEAASRIAEAGALVALLNRDGNSVMRGASEISDPRGGPIGIGSDPTRDEQIDDAADLVQRELGGCRVLVKKATVLSTNSDRVMEVALEKWNAQTAVNLTGALLDAQIFAQQMINRGPAGSITQSRFDHGATTHATRRRIQRGQGCHEHAVARTYDEVGVTPSPQQYRATGASVPPVERGRILKP